MANTRDWKTKFSIKYYLITFSLNHTLFSAFSARPDRAFPTVFSTQYPRNGNGWAWGRGCAFASFIQSALHVTVTVFIKSKSMVPIVCDLCLFQAFLLTMDKSAVIKEVLVVYHNWLKVGVPCFV